MNTDIRKRNDALKYHREIRGWSQQKVAELVETSEDMVGRWERGISKPSPFYRERLCNLFGVNAEELGFLEKTTNHEAPFQKADSSPTSPQHGAITTSPYFSFGHLETTWIVVDGDGTEEYRQKNIRTHFDPRPDKLPDDLAARREHIQKQQEENRRQGHPFQWNGERYSLDRFIISRSSIEEDLMLDLWFKPSDYYTFLATNQSLKDESVREKYLKEADWHSPVRYFSNSFGVSLVVITSDHHTLFTQRGKDLGSRPGEYNISVSEGLSKFLDHDAHRQAPDIFHCASRGLTEELGLSQPEDFKSSDIILLSLGVDTLYSLWGLRGMVKVHKTIEEITKHWNSGVKDKLENARIHPIKFDLHTIVPFVFSHEPWTPSALVCLYHTLVHEFGRKKVDEAIGRYCQ